MTLSDQIFYHKKIEKKMYGTIDIYSNDPINSSNLPTSVLLCQKMADRRGNDKICRHNKLFILVVATHICSNIKISK